MKTSNKRLSKFQRGLSHRKQETDTQKRRFEPDKTEPVDWFPSEISSVAWVTYHVHQREIYEIDVGDTLQHENSLCRSSTLWMSKMLSDGKATEVSYHHLPSGQQLPDNVAMTEEPAEVLAADAVRRLSREDALHFQLERLLRMR